MHFSSRRAARLVACNAHRNTHAATDAQGGEALLGIALLHLVEQRHQHAGAGGADGVADRDRATVDVDLGRIPAEVLVDRAGLRGEGLIGLDQIEVADVPAGLLQRGARGGNRPGTHDLGIDAGLAPRHDTTEDLLALLGRLPGGHQHHGGGAVIDAGGASRGDGAVLLESRLELGHRIQRGAVARIFVVGHDDVALAGLDGDRDDLVLELAGLLGGLGLVLRGDRELVLLGAGDLVLPRDVLGGIAHVVAVEGVPQPVLDHGVDEFDGAHFGAAAQVLRVRGHAHGFLAAGDDDFGIAVEQRLVAERDRAQAASAELVDAPGRAFHRDAGGDRGLAGRGLALRRGQDLTHDDLGDAAWLDAGPLQYGLDGDGAEIVGRRSGEGTVEAPDWGAGGADDDDIV